MSAFGTRYGPAPKHAAFATTAGLDEACGVTVDVAVERLLAAVDHAHGAARREREQAQVDLQRHVLARTERAADAREHQTHLRLGQPEAGGDLAEILVQPLRRDMQGHAAVRVGDRETRFGSERRLVLHPDLVLGLDDHVGPCVRIAVHDAHILDDVPVVVQG